MPRVVIAAGGTAGHVVPALAVADELRARGAESSGPARASAPRRELVPRRRLRDRVPRGARHRPPQPAARAGRGRARGRGRRRGARPAARASGADAVLGGGGYVAGPVGLAAVARRTPLVLTEADSHLGLANRCSRRSRAGCASRSRSRAARASATLVTGRPVPRAVARGRPRRPRASGSACRPDATCVLVFGGSLGARSLNLAAVEALARLGRARAAHHRPPRLRRGARARSASARPGYRGARVPRHARRPARGRRPRGRARRRLDLRDRGGGPARDPRPLPARDRRPPDRRTRAGWRTPARRSCCADAELTRRAPARGGRGAARRPASGWSGWRRRRARSRGPTPPRGSPTRCSAAVGARRRAGAGEDPWNGTARCTSSASAAPG